MLEDLIIKKIICEKVELYKSSAGFWTLESRIVDVAEGAETKI
ncbi:MAG: hypothetical protein QOK71_10430 [Nitrososphaeraceae archaeon]|nr:hypothetical protein [Nitrososphaeraceae archaeon]